MTYDANRGESVFHCDTCPEEIETGIADFHGALDAARAKGWKTYKGPDQQWAHACPACTEDFAKTKRGAR